MRRCRGAEHGRHLRRGFDRQPHGAVGRRRADDRHQSDRDRHSGRQGGAGGARHRHFGVVVRHHPAARGVGQADAGRLGGPQQDRQADQRPEEGRRRRAAADRRVQGQRPCADDRPARRRAQRRGVRPRRGRFTATGSEQTNTGQFIVAIDVSRFIPPEVFAAEMDRHLDELRSSPRLPGVDAIRMPGEDRRRRRAERTANGVALPADADEAARRSRGEVEDQAAGRRGRPSPSTASSAPLRGAGEPANRDGRTCRTSTLTPGISLTVRRADSPGDDAHRQQCCTASTASTRSPSPRTPAPPAAPAAAPPRPRRASCPGGCAGDRGY